MKNKGFSSIAVVLLIFTVIVGIIFYFIFSSTQNHNQRNTANNIELRDLTKAEDYFLPLDKFKNSSFQNNVTTGEKEGYYLLSYKNPWGIRQETSDAGCTTASYTRGPINLGKLTIKINCEKEKIYEKVQQNSVVVSIISNGDSSSYIIRQYDSKLNLYRYLFLTKDSLKKISNDDSLSNIISLYPFEFSATYSPEGTEKLEEGLKNIDTMMNSFTVEYLGKPIDENGVTGVITGTITLTYAIDSYPDVKDDITVSISEKRGIENNYFGATTCASEQDNCNWLLSEKGKTRIYGYRLTVEGGSDSIRIGENYMVYVSTRHWNDVSGNVSGEQSEKAKVSIPESGKATQDFYITVDGF